MLHFVTSYMKQNKSRKQTLESAQYGLEISFKVNKTEPFESNKPISSSYSEANLVQYSFAYNSWAKRFRDSQFGNSTSILESKSVI